MGASRWNPSNVDFVRQFTLTFANHLSALGLPYVRQLFFPIRQVARDGLVKTAANFGAIVQCGLHNSDAQGQLQKGRSAGIWDAQESGCSRRVNQSKVVPNLRPQKMSFPVANGRR